MTELSPEFVTDLEDEIRAEIRELAWVITVEMDSVQNCIATRNDKGLRYFLDRGRISMSHALQRFNMLADRRREIGGGD